MRYFKVNEKIKDNTTLSIITTEGERVIHYDSWGEEHYYGINTKDIHFLSKQHPECGVKEMQFEEIEPILKSCPLMKLANEQVVQLIREKYSIDDELKLVTIGISNPNDPEYLEHIAFKEKCREIGKQSKLDMGLI